MSASYFVELLWKQKFFNKEQTLAMVDNGINERWEHNFFPSDISKALAKAHFLRRIGKRRSFKYIQKISPANRKVVDIESELFSDALVKKLDKNFGDEIRDLRLNFGNSGTCTAFLLRKILEKLIYIVLSRNNMQVKIEDKKLPGGLMGLDRMIDVAAREKIRNIPVLTPKTAQKIGGIKFLGDTSAHNPLINVDMETIIPQMPFIITAYKELAERL